MIAQQLQSWSHLKSKSINLDKNLIRISGYLDDLNIRIPCPHLVYNYTDKKISYHTSTCLQ